MTDRQAQDEALLRIAGNIAKLGGWTVTVPELVVTWSNETAAIHEEPAGFSPSLDAAFSYYAPEYRDRVQQVFAACVAQGSYFDLELQIITAKGRRVWTRAIGEAVHNSAGAITHVQGAFQDISEQKLAEQQIQSLGNRLQETLETLADAFFTLDRDWRFTYVNGEA
ncbi:MAG: hypothetical protein RL701_7975, partial [Pseudomonadota bacterium]